MRLWFHVHSWVGVTAGLLLFIIVWSGTTAVFSREIDWAINPSIRAEGEVASWGAMERAVRAAYPDGAITSLNAPFAPGFASEATVESPTENIVRVYLDPRSGAIQGATSFFNVQRFFRSLHSEFFVGAGRLGIYIVTAFSFVMLASMITALIFYKRWWRGFFKLRAAKGGAVLISDAHKFTGVWSLAFMAIMALTGAWYFIEALDGDFRLFPRQDRLAAIERLEPPRTRLDLDALVARTQALRPGLDIRAILPPAKPGDPVVIQGQEGHLFVRDRADQVVLDSSSGAVLLNQRAPNLPLYFRWIETADVLHFGTFAGLASRVLWLVFGIGVSALCLTGAYVQAKKQRRAGVRWPRPAILAAAATTGGVLIMAALGAVDEINSYGPMEGPVRFPEAPWGVWAFIGAWLASALAGVAMTLRLVR